MVTEEKKGMWSYMIAGYALNGKDEEASDFKRCTPNASGRQLWIPV